jgi:hypothetical protein
MLSRTRYIGHLIVRIYYMVAHIVLVPGVGQDSYGTAVHCSAVHHIVETGTVREVVVEGTQRMGGAAAAAETGGSSNAVVVAEGVDKKTAGQEVEADKETGYNVVGAVGVEVGTTAVVLEAGMTVVEEDEDEEAAMKRAVH